MWRCRAPASTRLEKSVLYLQNANARTRSVTRQVSGDETSNISGSGDCLCSLGCRQVRACFSVRVDHHQHHNHYHQPSGRPPCVCFSCMCLPPPPPPPPPPPSPRWPSRRMCVCVLVCIRVIWQYDGWDFLDFGPRRRCENFGGQSKPLLSDELPPPFRSGTHPASLVPTSLEVFCQQGGDGTAVRAGSQDGRSARRHWSQVPPPPSVKRQKRPAVSCLHDEQARVRLPGSKVLWKAV
eukprot:12888031-Prorocentrum_lima.AAC.1